MSARSAHRYFSPAVESVAVPGLVEGEALLPRGRPPRKADRGA